VCSNEINSHGFKVSFEHTYENSVAFLKPFPSISACKIGSGIFMQCRLPSDILGISTFNP
jgi:hypothetical protein